MAQSTTSKQDLEVPGQTLSSTSSALCSKCEDFARWCCNTISCEPMQAGEKALHLSTRELRQNEERCALCARVCLFLKNNSPAWFSRYIQGVNLEEQEVAVSARPDTGPYYESRPNSVQVDIYSPPEKHWRIYDHWIRNDQPWLNATKPYEADPARQSEEVENIGLSSFRARIAQMQTWIRACDEDHEVCKKGSSNDLLPSRLVYVGDSDDAVRLCETSTLTGNIRYLTLSHCWGAQAITTLTTENYQDFLQHIPVVSLTRTFRDALQATRELAVAYLWIDSLCIIQNSKEDWDSEAPCMQQIYRGSYLNIAASDSSSGAEGLFRVYNPALCRSIACVDPASKRIEMLEGSSYLEAGFDELPLHKRAWVLQEVFLAKRTLHFGANQIFWQCRDRFSCDASPTRLEGILVPEMVFGNWWERSIATEDSSLFESFTKLHAGQRRLMQRFASAGIKHQSDRYLAFAGIASYLQDSYVNAGLDRQKYQGAGIWSDTFVLDLLWRRNLPDSSNICFNRGPPEDQDTSDEELGAVEINQMQLMESSTTAQRHRFQSPTWSLFTNDEAMEVSIHQIIHNLRYFSTPQPIQYKVASGFTNGPFSSWEHASVTINARAFRILVTRGMITIVSTIDTESDLSIWLDAEPSLWEEKMVFTCIMMAEEPGFLMGRATMTGLVLSVAKRSHLKLGDLAEHSESQPVYIRAGLFTLKGKTPRSSYQSFFSSLERADHIIY